MYATDSQFSLINSDEGTGGLARLCGAVCPTHFANSARQYRRRKATCSSKALPIACRWTRTSAFYAAISLIRDLDPIQRMHPDAFKRGKPINSYKDKRQNFRLRPTEGMNPNGGSSPPIRRPH